MTGILSDISFYLMSLTFKIRDFLKPPLQCLREAGLEPGWRVLDFGCGPGSYAVAAAETVGSTGMVYALDKNLTAIRMVQRKASNLGLTNLEAVHSHLDTGLAGESLDLVLLYDTFHDLEDPAPVMREIHRVLKPGGILSFSDHHLKEEDIMAGVTKGGLFVFLEKGPRTYRLSRP